MEIQVRDSENSKIWFLASCNKSLFLNLIKYLTSPDPTHSSRIDAYNVVLLSSDTVLHTILLRGTLHAVQCRIVKNGASFTTTPVNRHSQTTVMSSHTK